MQAKKTATKKTSSKPATKKGAVDNASTKKTSPRKSGATNTSKKAPRKAAATKKRTTRAAGKSEDAEGKPPVEHRPVGKPPINDPNDVAAVEDRINAFFEECTAGKRKATFCGLALALGYRSRTSLWEHAKANEPISEPINTAMLMIEDRYEGKLDTANSYGAQFALQNRGWKTTQVVETETPSQTHVYLPENNRWRA